MKRTIAVLAAAMGLMAGHSSAVDVGVSISVGEPGFYGRLDMGNIQSPQLIYAQPLIVQPAPAGVVYQPLYLRVPPGHARDWRKHCRHYNACGYPVYFVQDRWYQDVYVPRYREHHQGHKVRYDKDDHKGHGKGHNKKGHDKKDRD